MSRVRCSGSPTFDFQVDCTRIALDPRFKNMEGSIGARLIHVSEKKEARAPKTAPWGQLQVLSTTTFHMLELLGSGTWLL